MRKQQTFIVTFLLIMTLVLTVCVAAPTANPIDSAQPMGCWVAECPKCGADCYDDTETGNFTCDCCGAHFYTRKLK